MRTASISQTKNQLSALIDQVRQGETIVITDHERPVAKLVPVAEESHNGVSARIARLERMGVVRRGSGACRLDAPAALATGASAVATLMAERGEGR